tara:strand:+ start:1967 stop:2752 length:786 start_codon:yes stop_codon:yes gene_type:complete
MTGYIVIAGYGSVGQAHEKLLNNFDYMTQIVDPEYYRILGQKKTFLGRVSDYNPESIIICVSTPEDYDGACNMINVFDVLSQTDKNVPVLIKSTISIDGWVNLKEKFPQHKITFSPEYLRSETATKDLEDCENISLGGDDIAYWTEVFNNCGKNVTISEPEELIVAKIFRNAFLATKVSFFNQIFDYCKKENINFQKVSNEIGEDPRIGHSHTKVSEERGFGGHCFPKDTNAILKSADKVGIDLNIIRSAVEYNNKIRKNT